MNTPVSSVIFGKGNLLYKVSFTICLVHHALIIEYISALILLNPLNFHL